MNNHDYPPADFKFPPGFTFADQGTEHEKAARVALYFLLFDPEMCDLMDRMIEEEYEADMKEHDRMENDGYFDDVKEEAYEDPDDDYYDAFSFDDHFDQEE